MARTIGITVRRRSFTVVIVVRNIITVNGRIVDAQTGWRAGSNNNIVALDGVCRIGYVGFVFTFGVDAAVRFA